MKKPVLKKLTLVFIIVIASFVYGIFSANSRNVPFKAVRGVYKQIFSKTENAPKRRMWRRARNDDGSQELSKEQQEAMDKISDLPYLKGYSLAPEAENITIYDERLAYNGFNFVVSADAPRAYLIDMKGNTLHEWSKNFEDVWPEPFDLGGFQEDKEYWRPAWPLENGDLFAIFPDFGLIKLDKNSNLLWSYKGRTHHDLFEAENGNIYILTREVKKNANLGLVSGATKNRILEDFVTVLSPEGKEIKKISLVDCFLNSVYASHLEHINVPYDIFHTNTLKLIDGRLADTHPMFKKGHLLLSMRSIHTIAVVDPEQEKITWAITGMWKYQHAPRILDNGNLMLFDNRGNSGKSKIIELNPLTQEVVWIYKTEPADAFYSDVGGTNQRLPNGNTLITESTYGRAFEVTPEGKIVWEFLNPHRAGDNNELIAALYKLIRLGPDQTDWLEPSSKEFSHPSR